MFCFTNIKKRSNGVEISSPSDKSLTSDCCSLYNKVKSVSQKYLYKTALHFYGKEISFKELLNEIDLVSDALYNYGVKENDFVYLAMPTTPESIYLTYAINKIGANVVMLDVRTSYDEFIKIDNKAKGKILFVFDWTSKRLLKHKDLGNVKTIVELNAIESLIYFPFKLPNFKFKGEHLSYRGFLKKYKNEKISSICNNDAGIVFYTGGTTGVSKSVLIKSSHLNETVYQYSLNAFYHECDHLLNCMPIFTCYGFVLSVHQPLLLGIEMFIILLMKAKNMLKCIEKYKINHVFGVPSFFEKLINPNFKEDLSSLIYCLAAGDTMNVNKLN